MTFHEEDDRSLDSHSPIRRRRRVVLSVTANVPSPNSKQVTLAVGTITNSTLVQTFTPMLPYVRRQKRHPHSGGRTATMTLKAFFVGYLLLAIMEQPLFIRDIHRLLNNLDAGTRKKLGLPVHSVITERMVSYLFNQITADVDASIFSEGNQWIFDKEKVHAHLGLDPETELDDYEVASFANTFITNQRKKLDAMIRSGLRATHPADIVHGGDFAIDASNISSWENSRSNRRKKRIYIEAGKSVKRWPHPSEFSDPDARWWSKKNDGPIAKTGRAADTADFGLGYALTATSRMVEVIGFNIREEPIPLLIEHISLIPAGRNMWREGAAVVERMVRHHEDEDQAAGVADRPRGDLLADREYTRGQRWQLATHKAGFETHSKLTSQQRKSAKTLGCGVLVIDEIPYCPGMPDELKTTPELAVFETREQRARAAKFYDRRKPYRIKAIGGTRAEDGSLKLSCLASNVNGHQVICERKPASIEGNPDRPQIGNSAAVFLGTTIPTICSQSTVTASFDELPHWQPHIPGSPEHQWYVNRRSSMEGAFAKLKDEAGQSIRRGNVRTMGRTKMSVAILMLSMAANLATYAHYLQRVALGYTAEHVPAKKRVPRRITIAREKAGAKREARRAERLLDEEFAKEGKILNRDSGEITFIDDGTHRTDP